MKNCRRMKEEQECFEGGHATSSIMREGEGRERLGDNDGRREEEDRVTDDYGIATIGDGCTTIGMND